MEQTVLRWQSVFQRIEYGMKYYLRASAKWLAVGAGTVAAIYGTFVGITWFRFGNAAGPGPDERDALLDRFMPTYEIVERHHVRVAAPARLTLEVARGVDLQDSPVVRTIIRARELLLGATPGNDRRPRGLLAEVQSLGWGVLADIPEREVVVGAVTKPWKANVTFRALPAEQFAAFSDPGYVKIAWTIRAEPISDTESVFRTETRAMSTDSTARAKFRRYWSFLSPGIITIRWAVLGPVKKEAEYRAREGYALRDGSPH
jgi:hypothetical protein